MRRVILTPISPPDHGHQFSATARFSDSVQTTPTHAPDATSNGKHRETTCDQSASCSTGDDVSNTTIGRRGSSDTYGKANATN